MRDFPRFIKLGEDRINVDEIISYGINFDDEYIVEEDEDSADEEYEVDRYLYVDTRSSEFRFEYWDGEVDFDIDEKLVELDAMFLVAAHRPR